jgi:D-alanyl-D-alanine carboxypeptidase/D-alanyl-D-alanine-endopeptidase (penicillin-binding protein 4)
VHTAARGARLDIAVGAVPGCVTLRGSIPAGREPWSTRFAAPDPLRLFASVLMAALEAGGIAVAGDAVQLRGAPPGRLLASLRTPLLEVLAPINLHSNNAVADQLFFALGDAVGGAGTRAGGQAATRRALTKLGLPAGGLVQVDGSGLSRDSRLTARQLTALLSATANLDGATFEYFYRSLPVAGESGSLLGRMTSGPARGRVHAKTGWIGGASALSGFVETAQGKRLVFSILVSYPRESGLNTSCWKPMQDAICAALVNWNG